MKRILVTGAGLSAAAVLLAATGDAGAAQDTADGTVEFCGSHQGLETPFFLDGPVGRAVTFGPGNECKSVRVPPGKYLVGYAVVDSLRCSAMSVRTERDGDAYRHDSEFPQFVTVASAKTTTFDVVMDCD